MQCFRTIFGVLSFFTLLHYWIESSDVKSVLKQNCSRLYYTADEAKCCRKAKHTLKKRQALCHIDRHRIAIALLWLPEQNVNVPTQHVQFSLWHVRERRDHLITVQLIYFPTEQKTTRQAVMWVLQTVLCHIRIQNRKMETIANA